MQNYDLIVIGSGPAVSAPPIQGAPSSASVSL
jgi:pyruvate/2-oxoglutarate dehydrogenase complex dihydrolipoamide dehydrogenase (E3) component